MSVAGPSTCGCASSGHAPGQAFVGGPRMPARRGRRAPASHGRSKAQPPGAPGRADGQQRLERQIEAAEAALRALEDELSDPAAWSTPEASARSSPRHEEASARSPSSMSAGRRSPDKSTNVYRLYAGLRSERWLGGQAAIFATPARDRRAQPGNGSDRDRRWQPHGDRAVGQHCWQRDIAGTPNAISTPAIPPLTEPGIGSVLPPGPRSRRSPRPAPRAKRRRRAASPTARRRRTASRRPRRPAEGRPTSRACKLSRTASPTAPAALASRARTAGPRLRRRARMKASETARAPIANDGGGGGYRAHDDRPVTAREAERQCWPPANTIEPRNTE